MNYRAILLLLVGALLTHVNMHISVPLRPFSIPSFVIAVAQPRPRQEGPTLSPSWPLSDLDVTTLSDMCDQFRADIFKKAGKTDPRATHSNA